MSVRLLLGVALVVHILVIVVCTGQATSATDSSVSTVSATSSKSYASSTSSAKAVVVSKPKKCRRVRKCPKNEEFSFCPQSIKRAQYCSEKAEPYRSTSSNRCKEGCVCKENYLRADNGKCIPAEQCPLTCGANEVLDNCPTDCDSEYCPTEEDTEAEPCIMPEVCPPPVCKCAFNHRRASNGSCILTRDCPAFDCSYRPNEEYDSCPPICPTDDCSQASSTGECPPQFGRIGIVLPCKPECRCIQDYWRLDGICIPYGQCPGVCPDNERYSTCIQAECRALNCTQKDQPVPCIRLDPKYCEKGCVCQEGYLRNEDGICVLEDKCEPPSCPDNEEFVPCMQGVCRAKDCSQRGEDVPCPDIPQEKCDSGCICKEHFLRAENGSCVPEDQCEPGICPSNEIYSTCIQAECRALNCTQKGQPVPCIRLDPKYCKKECVCQEGYLRNENGVCVLEDKCEPQSCPANEEFVLCMQGVCRAKDCSQRGEVVPCPDIPQEKCDSGCICKEHFLRAENGSCVPEDQCEPPVCPPNEEWSTCAQATCRAQNCTQRGKPIACPMIMDGYCVEACVCKENYLRNGNGDCIPEDQCPCGDNEVLDECPMTCSSDYCPQSADEEQVCTQADPCVPACKCQFNYKRAENGTCIPTRDCPPFDCSAKANEEFVACPPLCPTDECGKSRLEGRCPFRIGIILKCEPKCQCKDGYGRVNGTCVPFEECPGICPDNERYSACIQAECRALNCTQKGQPVPCIRLDPKYCKKGCVCQEGYLRNEDGVCVLEDKCEPQSCPANEEFVPCMQGVCRAKDCSQREEDVPCPDIPQEKCDSGCICKEHFLRAENGSCVPEDQCEQPSCKENEVYTDCKRPCPPEICFSLTVQFRCGYHPCEKGCICKPGYLREEDDPPSPCIPICQCPEKDYLKDCKA